MIDPVEKVLHAAYSRSPDRIKRLFREIAYWLCEWLGGYVARRTSCEINNAGAAIAAVRMFDMKNLVEVPEDELPDLLRNSLPPFTPAEWKEVLASAHMDWGVIEQALQNHPEWAYLRKTPAT